MKQELQDKLKMLYGTMIPEYNYEKSEGILVNDGWYRLLQEMFGCIKHHEEQLKISDEYRKKNGLQELNIDYDPVEFSQVREKFGGLRCSYIGGDSYTTGVIHMAESMSFQICEICGQNGEIRNLSWMKALCDQHYKDSCENNLLFSHDLSNLKE